MKLKSLSQKEIYDMLREQIKHEDDLINGRTNWLLVVQGFLFTAYTTLVTNVTIALFKRTALMTVLGLTGLILSIFGLLGILASFHHLAALVDVWEKPQNDDEGKIAAARNEFPPLLGRGKWIIINGGFGSTGTAVLLIFVWLFLLMNAR